MYNIRDHLYLGVINNHSHSFNFKIFTVNLIIYFLILIKNNKNMVRSINKINLKKNNNN